MPNFDILAEIRRRALAALVPPEQIPLSAWIEANIVLPTGLTAVAGPMRLYKPQREVADALGNPEYTRVSVLKSARVGYTCLATAAIAYWAIQDPGPILILMPVESDAKDYMSTDLEPIFSGSPALQGVLSADSLVGQRGKTRNTILSRRFAGGSIKCVAAKAPRNLRRHTIRYLVMDEIDGDESFHGEGNPLDLAEKRTLSFSDRRIVIGSTPKLVETSFILPAFEAGDQRIYHVACVSCGGLTPIAWANIQWDHDRPETAYFRCPLCDAKVEERFKNEMVEAGAWIPQRPEVKGHASFLWTSLISPLQNASWAALAKEFLVAKDDPARLQVFVNTILAEGWKSQGDDLAEDELASRVEEFGLDRIPAEVLCITCGVDCQDDRLECTFAGWSRVPGECFVLGHTVIYGPITSDTVWQDMDGLLKQRWAHPLGGTIGVDGAIIDAGDGGHFDLVMRFCAARVSRRVYAGKGMPGFSRAAFALSEGLRKRGNQRLVLVGVDGLKSLLFAKLQRGQLIHFSNSLDANWFDQLCSERRAVKYSRGRPAPLFERIPGRRAEALDALIYATSAREGVALNLDMREAALKMEPQSAPRPAVIRSRWLDGVGIG